MRVNMPRVYEFSRLEKSLIKDLSDYCALHKLESARIIKNNTDITDKFTIIEKPYSHIALPKGFSLTNTGKDEFEEISNKRKQLLEDCVYIHNHPENLPLSIPDILQVCVNKIKKMVAITIDGKLSIFEHQGNLDKISEELVKFNNKLRNLICEQGADYILKNAEQKEKYIKNLENVYKNLCEKYGGKYYSDL